MKKTEGKMFKRIVSTALVATLTLGTVYIAYTREGGNTNVVESERPYETYVVQDNIASKVDENIIISANNNPENSVILNEKNIMNVNGDNTNASTVELPEVTVNENVESVAELTDTFDDINTIHGEKIGSNVVTLVESEDGYLYEEVVDTDEDGIPDGYEVFVLCTNPYLKDSDFDGINDNEDVEPLKTNVDTGIEVDYTIPVKKGMFDLVSTYTDENGNNCELVYNYLNGQIKYISDSENQRYSVYNEANQLVAAIEYVDEKIIANTYSYKDGNIETITHNGFQYTFTYDENGNLTGIRSESGFCIGYKEEENSYTISYEYAETTKTQTTTQTEETDENGDITKNIITTNLISGGKLVTVISEEDSTERTLYVNGTALLSSKYTSSDKGITKIEYQDGKVLEYDYDEIGNIISVTENGELKLSYEYDSLGQLVRENNLYAGKSYTYTYDNAGNILESMEYAYSTEELTETESVKTYEYNDRDWKDLLTSFNGQAITYDEIGNPLTYRDGMTFSWTGRQLCTVNIGEDVISYTYNSDGIRTSKTVNGVATTYQLDG